MGWRETGVRPECWFVHAGGQAGEPFQAVSIDGITSDVAGGSERLQSLQRPPVTPSTPPRSTGRSATGRLIEGIRGCAGAAVGGFCQLTTVTRDEIGMRILRRWPSTSQWLSPPPFTLLVER